MRSPLGAAAVLSVLAFNAPAQEAVINGDAVRPFFAKAKFGRADMVGIGDSNQLQQSTGWDHGWNRALALRYGMYATGLLSLGEGQGNGGGAGYGYSTITTGFTGAFDYTNAPPDLATFLNNPPSLLGPLGYLHVPAGASVPGSVGCGMSLSTSSPVSVNAHLRFSLVYGMFPGSQSGAFRLSLRRDSAPFNVIASGPQLTTASQDPAHTAIALLELPRARRSYPIALRCSLPTEQLTGPFIAYYARAENIDASHGASFTTLYGVGSQSARDMAAALLASSDNTLSLFFGLLRQAQDEPRRVLVRISSALNDRAEDLPSVGPHHFTPGFSPDAYEENLRAMLTRIRGIWNLNGWDPDELYFLLTPSQPVSDPDEPALLAFRDRAEAVARSEPRTACVRLDRLTSATEMLDSGWYNLSGLDHNHMTQAGYENLSQRELLALIALACPADFNEDGGIDGADIEAFFSAWRTGDPLADVNQDGGVDGGDVERFFELWEASAC